VLETDRGPNFYDVSGNQEVSVGDAHRVINELSRSRQTTVEAEQVPQALLNDADRNGRAMVAEEVAPIDLSSPDKIVDESMIAQVSSDVVDLIAADHASDADTDSVVGAIDAAMADLL
jgi:hypothetical protein